uniref:Plasma membrane proteolipid 3 n=1 Tax=Strongyloides stercoralis TaxID=6248 RepID=A0A0K0EHF9_STRER
MGACNDFCMIIVCIIFPPIAVGLVDGCGCQLLINILLCCLGWLPGLIHAFWRTLCVDDHCRHHH